MCFFQMGERFTFEITLIMVYVSFSFSFFSFSFILSVLWHGFQEWVLDFGACIRHEKIDMNWLYRWYMSTYQKHIKITILSIKGRIVIHIGPVYLSGWYTYEMDVIPMFGFLFPWQESHRPLKWDFQSLQLKLGSL